MSTAEKWAQSEENVRYAQEILAKASKQLENVINARKIAKAELDALVSEKEPIKLLPVSDGKFILLQWGRYECDAQLVTPEKPPEPV